MHQKKKAEFQDRTLLNLKALKNTNATQKYYQALNVQRKGFNPHINMCHTSEGALLTCKDDILNRWREHFDALLNSSARDDETNIDYTSDYSFLDDDVSIVAIEPTRDEVSTAINSLKTTRPQDPITYQPNFLNMGVMI